MTWECAVKAFVAILAGVVIAFAYATVLWHLGFWRHPVDLCTAVVLGTIVGRTTFDLQQ